MPVKNSYKLQPKIIMTKKIIKYLYMYIKTNIKENSKSMLLETAIIHKALAGIIQYCIIQEPAFSELCQLLPKVSPATFTRDKLALPKCLQNAFSGITIPRGWIL